MHSIMRCKILVYFKDLISRMFSIHVNQTAGLDEALHVCGALCGKSVKFQLARNILFLFCGKTSQKVASEINVFSPIKEVEYVIESAKPSCI